MAMDVEHVRLGRRDSVAWLSSPYEPRIRSSLRTLHGSFSARIILLVDLDTVARAELDVWNQHTMGSRSKITEDRLQASLALRILLLLTVNSAAPVQSPHVLEGNTLDVFSPTEVYEPIISTTTVRNSGPYTRGTQATFASCCWNTSPLLLSYVYLRPGRDLGS